MVNQKKINGKVILYEVMAKRITIMIDDDLDKKIRLIQAKAIQSTTNSVSYSRTINDLIRKNLKS